MHKDQQDKGRLDKAKNTQYVYPIINDYINNVYNVSSATILDYVLIINKFCEFIKEKTGADDLRESDINKYIVEFLNVSRVKEDGSRFSYSKEKMMFFALNSFLKYLKRIKVISDNPLDDLTVTRGSDIVGRPEFDTDDLNFILMAVKLYKNPQKVSIAGLNPHNKDDFRKARTLCERYSKYYEGYYRNVLIFKLAMTTGMRRSAISNIDLSDITCEDNDLYLTVKEKRNHIEKYSLKHLADDLSLYLKERDDILKRRNLNNVDALLLNQYGNRMSPHALNELFTSITRGLYQDFDRIRPHDLRAAFATITYNDTKDIVRTMKAMRHANIETTKRYIKIYEDVTSISSDAISKRLL